MRQIQAFHMDTRGWSDIAYNFCVDDDGTIYEGRGAFAAGGHTKGDNTTSHAICIMGNTHARDLTQAQVNSIAWLVREGYVEGWWVAPKITGLHRDAQAWGYSPYNGTACAGDFAAARLDEINAIASQEEDVMTPAQEEKLDRVLASLTRVENDHFPALGGTVREVDMFGQKGRRSDLWRWAGEGVTELRAQTAEKIADAVVAKLPDGPEGEKVRGYVIEGIKEVLGSLDD